MVSFICDACQETVRKPKVESHCFKCRDCWVLSCVDCGVSFEGEAYSSHTSCISEAEKYQGKLYQQYNPKANKSGNSNEDVQARWVNVVNHVASTTKTTKDPETLTILAGMSEYDNIPRKRKKFENFLKNSFRVKNQGALNEVWELLELEWANNKKEIDKQKAEEKLAKENEKKKKAAEKDKPKGKLNKENSKDNNEPDVEPDKGSKKRKRNDAEKESSKKAKPTKGWKKAVRKEIKKSSGLKLNDFLNTLESKDISNLEKDRLVCFLTTMNGKLKFNVKDKTAQVTFGSDGVSYKNTIEKLKLKKGWKKAIRKQLRKMPNLDLEKIVSHLASEGYDNIGAQRILKYLTSMEESALEVQAGSKSVTIKL